MRLRKLRLFLTTTAYLCGCAPANSTTPSPVPTATTPPSPVPTQTLIPSPTEIHVPEVFNNLPEGFVPIRNEDNTWGVGRKINGETIPIPGINFSESKLMLN